MLALEQFAYCPRCGAGVAHRSNPLCCNKCNFTYFFNPTVAAAAFVFDSANRAVFIRRAKDPKRGLLTVPGGFIDIDEDAETALRREVREEVGLEIEAISFLTSKPNRYLFKDVEYPVCDLIFQAKAVNPADAQALDGAVSVHWLRLDEVLQSDLAFPSVIQGWELLKSTNK